jgi:hypothetical protein
MGNWYYKNFVEWGDRRFMIYGSHPNKVLHFLWMHTVGLPHIVGLYWIFYNPWG